MAKISGPLFSLAASGTLGPRLTFSKRRSGQQVRFQREQKDYLSAARVNPRKFYSAACGWWNQLSTAEQAEWEVISRGED